MTSESVFKEISIKYPKDVRGEPRFGKAGKADSLGTNQSRIGTLFYLQFIGRDFSWYSVPSLPTTSHHFKV